MSCNKKKVHSCSLKIRISQPSKVMFTILGLTNHDVDLKIMHLSKVYIHWPSHMRDSRIRGRSLMLFSAPEDLGEQVCRLIGIIAVLTCQLVHFDGYWLK